MVTQRKKKSAIAYQVNQYLFVCFNERPNAVFCTAEHY